MTEVSRRHFNRVLAAAAAYAAAAGVIGSFCSKALASDAAPRGYAFHPEKGLVKMTQDLAKLAAEHFETLIGETFAVGEYRLKLRSVRRMTETPSRFRNQFSITFDVPRGLPIQSEVLPVSHQAIGRHDLLVTQVFDDIDGTAIEICFA
jgi:hypothetical protein